MTPGKPPSMNADKRQILSDITDAIHVVSDHVPPSEKIDMDTTLVAGLALESLEVANLFLTLSRRYGGIVSVADFILEVTDNGAISDLSVGRIVDFVANSKQPGHIDSSRAAELDSDATAPLCGNRNAALSSAVAAAGQRCCRTSSRPIRRACPSRNPWGA